MAASLSGQIARRSLGPSRCRPRIDAIRSASTAAPSSSGALLRAFALTSGALGLGYALALAYPPELLRVINPRVAPVSPHAESAEGIAATAKVERELHALEIVQRLRAARTDDGRPKWVETRPYTRYDENRRRHKCGGPARSGADRAA